jgi:hypothetical protein
MLCYVKLHNLNHIPVHKNTQGKRLKASTILAVHTEMRTSAEFCTCHRNDLDYSASARTKRKLERSGLVESRLHCTIDM